LREDTAKHCVRTRQYLSMGDFDLLIIPPVLHAANGAGGGRDHLPQGRGFSQVPDIPGLGGVVPTFQNSCPFRGPSDDAKQASRQIFACHPKHESEWGVSDDALRLHLLPVTPGKIVPFRMVLIVCKEYSINSLDQLEKYFSETYSTPFMRDKLRNDSTNVRQRTRNESLFEAGNVIRRLVVVLISMYNDCPATVAKIERIGCSGSLQSMVVIPTTSSGLVLDEPSVPMPPPFINPEEDECVEETFTDPEHAIHVSPSFWEEFEAYLASDSFPPGNSNPSSLLPPFHNSLSGGTTSSSPSLHISETSDYFLEEFVDELAHITSPPGNDDHPFDAEFVLLELEYLLNHNPIKDVDSILEDSVD
ncbi:hypothetical protein Tco_1492814, partial [Tanacetum coccineum]